MPIYKIRVDEYVCNIYEFDMEADDEQDAYDRAYEHLCDANLVADWTEFESANTRIWSEVRRVWQ